MEISQREAVLTLIYKKGDRNEIKNYRPINLTNIDYKILAFTLSHRIKKVIPSIISAYVKSRYIGQNIRLIQDIIEHNKINSSSGILMFIDFEKAFDSLEQYFLFKTFKKFNFGNDFIKWIKTLYTNSSVCVKNNGYISDFFKQGCPISAILFILVTEILSIQIKQDRNRHGIKINTTGTLREVKCTQYADDTTFYLKTKQVLVLSSNS